MNRLLQEEQTAAYTMWIHCMANIRTTNAADPLSSPSRPSSRSLFRSPALQSKSRNCEEKTVWSGTRETPLVEEKGKVTHRSRRKLLPASLRFPQDSRWTHSCVAGVIAGTCVAPLACGSGNRVRRRPPCCRQANRRSRAST